MGTVTKTIGVTGRDFSTIATWAASLPANLVTDGNSYVGQCFNDAEFFVSGGVVNFTGHTTDSTHTITLTCGAGQSWKDNANKRTNRATYNQANGVGIRSNAAYAAGAPIQNSDANVFFTGLQIKNSSAAGYGIYGTGAATIDSCIVYAGMTIVKNNNGLIRNCLIIKDSNDTSMPAVVSDSGSPFTTIVNTTIVRPSNRTAGGTAIASQYGSGVIRNVAAFGFATFKSGTMAVNADGHNGTDLATAVGTTGNVVSLAYASQFVTTTTASSLEDFRTQGSSGLVNVGVTDTTNVPGAVDGSGTARPQGVAWDIGFWEADPPAATAYTITGPSTCTVGSASTAFTSSANGSTAATVTVTSSVPGDTITTSPFAAAGGSFTVNASTIGARTLTFTNSGSLTNQSPLTLTASAPVIAPTGAIRAGSAGVAVGGNTVTVTLDTTNTPTTGVMSLTADPSAPNGAVNQGPVSIDVTTTPNVGVAVFAAVPSGLYSAETGTVGNTAGTVAITGSQVFEIIAVDGHPVDGGGSSSATAVVITGASSATIGTPITLTITTDVALTSGQSESIALSDGAGGTITPSTVNLDSTTTSTTVSYTAAGSAGTRTVTGTATGTPTLTAGTKVITVSVVATAPSLTIDSVSYNGNILRASGTVDFHGDGAGTLVGYFDPQPSGAATGPYTPTIVGNAWSFSQTVASTVDRKVRMVANGNSMQTTVSSATLSVIGASGGIVLPTA